MSGSPDYTTTPNLGLYMPNYDMDDGTWGTHLNANASVLDSAVHGLQTVTAGGPWLPLAGNATVTGPTTFSATGTGLTVTNDAAVNGTLTMSGNRVQSGASITRGISLFSNFSGTYTGGSNIIANADFSISSDSVVTGAAGGAYNGYFGQTVNGATLTGNRTTVGAVLNVTAKTANTGFPGKYYVASAGIATASTNDNGTAGGGNSCGKLFGSNFSAELLAGSTFWTDVVGQEVDVGIDTGASAAFKVGVKIVLFHNDAVRGSVTDAGLAFALQQQSGVTSPGFLRGISFSQAEGWWPFAADSTLIGCEVPAGGGPAMVAANGIDLSAVTIGSAAFKSAGFQVDGSGNTSMARAGFNNTAPIAKPTVTGSRGGNAAIASLLTQLAAYGLIADSTTA